METTSAEQNRLLSTVIAVTFAATGGVVREILAERQHTAWRFLAGMIVSAFTGTVVYFLCKHFSFDEDLTAAATGIGGYIGTPMLDAIAKLIRGKIMYS